LPKLQTNGAKQKRTTYMILLLWAAVCFALLVVDWCCWAPNRLDADMASEQLLANLLAQEGGVMSTNWYYSTELRVLNTQLVMAPLFRLFTSWHTVRVVGSVVLILLYLAAWFWFGRSAKLKYSGLLGACGRLYEQVACRPAESHFRDAAKMVHLRFMALLPGGWSFPFWKQPPRISRQLPIFARLSLWPASSVPAGSV